MRAELRFPAMGSEAQVLVVGPGSAAAARRAQRRIAELERRWSRFDPGSEISQVNANPDHAVEMSVDTVELVVRALRACVETGGWFDPTVLAAVVAAGYDRTFVELRVAPGQGGRPTPGCGCDAVSLDPELRTLSVPSGVGLDVGGIAKGFAADLVTDELLAAGATGALVNLGGDIRVRGRPPAGDRWPISVADPFDPGRELLRLAIEDGAVATSSRLARRWVGASGRPSHHLIDPVSGAPMESDVVAVTVVAGEGWWAEAQTKALFALGAEHGLRQLRNASAAVVDSRGRLATTPDLEAARR